MPNDQSPAYPPDMSRCNRHGVLFNKKRYNSCAVCRAAPDSPAMAASSVVLGIVGLTLIVGGMAMAGKQTMTALANAGERAVAETARSIRLDPREVRREIESLEAVLYGPPAEAEMQGEEIRTAASRLAAAVTTISGAPQPLLDRFSREIEAFGARSNPRRSSDPSSRGMTTHVDWETVRSRIFAEADWYRYSRPGTVSITSMSVR